MLSPFETAQREDYSMTGATQVGELTTSETVAVGLIGAGLAVGLAAVIANPARREVIVREARRLGIEDKGRGLVASVLERVAELIRGGGTSIMLRSS